MRGFSSVLVLALLALSFGGCSGGSSSPGMLPASGTQSQHRGTAVLRIKIPPKSASLRSSTRRAHYVSPSTTQLLLDIKKGEKSVSGYPQTIGLTPASPDCSASSGSTVCSISISLAPGTYTADLTAEDTNGHALSIAQGVALTIAAGATNSANIVLTGVPALLSLSSTSPLVTGTVGTGLVLVGPGAHSFVIGELDADGNTILLSSPPSLSVQQSGSMTVAVATPSPSNPNVLTISPPATLSSGTANVTISVSGAPGSISTSFTEQQLIAVAYDGTSPNGSIALFADTPSAAISSTPIESITNGVNGPIAVAFDKNGTMYVANTGAGTGSDTVTEYAPPYDGTPITISNLSTPTAIAVDASDHLFVATGTPSIGVYEYASGSTTASRTIGEAGGITEPDSLCTDPAGDLFVSNGGGAGNIEKYAPGATSETAILSPTLFSNSVACDSLGDVFQAQYGYNDNTGFNVTGANEYNNALNYSTGFGWPGTSGPTLVYADSANNFYLGIGGGSTTQLQKYTYSGGTLTAGTVITAGINYPKHMVADASGNLFVSFETTFSEYLSSALTSVAVTVNETGPAYFLTGIAITQ